MEASIIDRILPIYHKAPKKRLGLLCLDISNNSGINDIELEVITCCTEHVESLITNCVGIARDQLYGQITEDEALSKIKELSITKEEDSLKIILERANYYARR